MSIMKKTLVQTKSPVTSISESISSTISMWANLLAILAAIAITGLIDISVEPTVQIHQPTYLVGRQCLQKGLSDSRYPLADSLIDRIFESKSTLFVDLPYPHALFIRSSGVPISSRFKTADGTYYEYRELTDGSKILRSTDVGYDPESELEGGSNLIFEPDLPKASQKTLKPHEKRLQVMPFFTNLMAAQHGSYRRVLTTDSLKEIEREFGSFKTEPPLFLMNAVLNCRKVFSILSIENNSAYDIEDLRLQFYKKRSIAVDDRLKLEAWTIGESEVYHDTNTGREISIHIPNLSANSGLQLIISSLISQIKNEDIIVRYERLKSLDETLVWLVVLVTLLVSAACRFTIEFSRRRQANES